MRVQSCHDVLKLSVNLGDIAIKYINVIDYRYIISRNSKYDAIN